MEQSGLIKKVITIGVSSNKYKHFEQVAKSIANHLGIELTILEYGQRHYLFYVEYAFKLLVVAENETIIDEFKHLL